MEDMHVRKSTNMVGTCSVFEGPREIVQSRVVGGHQRVAQGDVAELVRQQGRGNVIFGGFLDQFDGCVVGNTEIQVNTCFKILVEEVVTQCAIDDFFANKLGIWDFWIRHDFPQMTAFAIMNGWQSYHVLVI